MTVSLDRRGERNQRYVARLFDGFSQTHQDVVIDAFLAAYTGKGSNLVKKDYFSQMPLPNWSVKYDGFGKIKALKKTFKGIILSHTYRSTMSSTSV